MKFGDWEIVGEASKSKAGKRMVHVVCSCGSKHTVQFGNLKSGRSTCCVSCGRSGHYNRRTHGEALKPTPEYGAWKSIKYRCDNVHASNYSTYGGRGIKVCQRWCGPEGFKHFLRDMGRRPDESYSIDRIDNEGNYEPQNCRWASKVTQNNNKRTNIVLTVQGKTMTLAEWCRKTGVNYAAAYKRFKSGGKTSEYVVGMESN